MCLSQAISILKSVLGMYYGGYSNSVFNTVTRLDSTGTMLGNETTAGTAIRHLTDASVKNTGMYLF